MFGGLNWVLLDAELNITCGRELANDPKLKAVWWDILIPPPDETVAVLALTWGPEVAVVVRIIPDVAGPLRIIPDVAGPLRIIPDVAGEFLIVDGTVTGRWACEMVVSKRTFRNADVSRVLGLTMCVSVEQPEGQFMQFWPACLMAVAMYPSSWLCDEPGYKAESPVSPY